MFEKLTDSARQALALAEGIARASNHGQIGTEHLVCGLCAGGTGAVGRFFDTRNITLTKLKKTLLDTTPKGPTPYSGHLPFMSDTDTALMRALREALSLGHNYIGPEHLLLAVAHDSDCKGLQILVANGFEDGTDVRIAVKAELANHS